MEISSIWYPVTMSKSSQHFIVKVALRISTDFFIFFTDILGVSSMIDRVTGENIGNHPLCSDSM